MTTTDLNEVVSTTKLDEFMAVYEPALREMITAHPQDYGFPPEEAHRVAESMRTAMVTGNYNHAGRAYKLTAKRLGIKYTRGAIEAFLGLRPLTGKKKA
jgi:hypothetical protein